MGCQHIPIALFLLAACATSGQQGNPATPQSLAKPSANTATVKDKPTPVSAQDVENLGVLEFYWRFANGLTEHVYEKTTLEDGSSVYQDYRADGSLVNYSVNSSLPIGPVPTQSGFSVRGLDIGKICDELPLLAHSINKNKSLAIELVGEQESYERQIKCLSSLDFDHLWFLADVPRPFALALVNSPMGSKLRRVSVYLRDGEEALVEKLLVPSLVDLTIDGDSQSIEKIVHLIPKTLRNLTVSAPLTNYSFLKSLPLLRTLRLDGNRLQESPHITEINWDYLTNVEVLYIGNIHSSSIRGITSLSKLKALFIRNSKLSPKVISEIGQLGQLVYLNLEENQVKNIAPLGNLKKLRVLDLAANPIKDISSLAGLSDLHNLRVSHTKTKDISAVRSLASLHTLDIGLTRVRDLSPLSNATNLRFLRIEATPVSNLDALSGLTLDSLDAGFSKVSDIRALSKSPPKSLRLIYTKVTSLASLCQTRSIHTIDISENGITDLGPLAKCNELVYLNADNTQVSDLSPLSGLRKLQGLSVRNTPVSSIDALADISSLHTLHIPNSKVTSLASLSRLKELQVLNISLLSVSNIDALKSRRLPLTRLCAILTKIPSEEFAKLKIKKLILSVEAIPYKGWHPESISELKPNYYSHGNSTLASCDF